MDKVIYMKLSKDEFCEVIDKIKAHHAMIENLEDILGVVFEFDDLQDTVIKLLEKVMDVEPCEKFGSDISYFIYDLDYGNDWTPSSFTIDGESVDISTAEKLYDYLMSLESVDKK